MVAVFRNLPTEFYRIYGGFDAMRRMGTEPSIFAGFGEKTYLEVPFSTSGITVDDSCCIAKTKALCIMNKIYGFPLRVTGDNPNHHLWNNNGVWWLHYTIYPTAFTSERVRRSLGTRSLKIARNRRDQLFHNLEQRVQSVCA